MDFLGGTSGLAQSFSSTPVYVLSLQSSPWVYENSAQCLRKSEIRMLRCLWSWKLGSFRGVCVVLLNGLEIWQKEQGETIFLRLMLVSPGLRESHMSFWRYVWKSGGFCCVCVWFFFFPVKWFLIFWESWGFVWEKQSLVYLELALSSLSSWGCCVLFLCGAN